MDEATEMKKKKKASERWWVWTRWLVREVSLSGQSLADHIPELSVLRAPAGNPFSVRVNSPYIRHHDSLCLSSYIHRCRDRFEPLLPPPMWEPPLEAEILQCPSPEPATPCKGRHEARQHQFRAVSEKYWLDFSNLSTPGGEKASVGASSFLSSLPTPS